MKCYLCDSTNHKKREGKVRDNSKLDILECDDCGLVFLSSLDHMNKEFYEESNMSVNFTIDEWLKETFHDDERRFEFIKPMIANKDIADFGSGAGGYLLKAKGIANSIKGIELDKKIKQHYADNGIELVRDIEDIKDSSLDVITAFHVVEHLSEPIDILEMLIKKLKIDGKLIIEVPNSNDALLTIYNNKAFSEFTYWSPHLFLYNSHTLELLFKKINGVKIDFIKYIQRYPLSNHLYWLSKDKPAGHKHWGDFIDSSELSKAYESQLASIGATDTIIMQLTRK